jgi:hypothetical protein
VSLDDVEHLTSYGLIRTDQHYERAVPVQHCPDARPDRQRALARPTGHGEGEQLATQHSRLNLGDSRQMVSGPRQRKGFSAVRFAKLLERVSA